MSGAGQGWLGDGARSIPVCRLVRHDSPSRRCTPHRALPTLPPPALPACCSFSAHDQTHSFPQSGHGLRRVLRLLAPTLQELSIAHCSDIFHATTFADLAPLQVRRACAVCVPLPVSVGGGFGGGAPAAGARMPPCHHISASNGGAPRPLLLPCPALSCPQPGAEPGDAGGDFHDGACVSR